MRRRLHVTTGLLAAVLAACAEPEPSFGLAGGIVGKRLPNEPTGGAEAFGDAYSPTANKPATTMKAAHAGKPGPQPNDTINCLDCHKAGAAAATKPFAYGGRIVDKAGPTPDADVIVIQDGTKLGPVKSDADGFFWFSGGAVKDGATTYVRKEAAVQKMGGALKADKDNSCDSASCHVPGKQGKINI